MKGTRGREFVGSILLCVATVVAFFGAAAFRMPVYEPVHGYLFNEVRIRPERSPQDRGGQLVLHSDAGGVDLALGADGRWIAYGPEVKLNIEPDRRSIAHLLSTPISLNWRHPLFGLPEAWVARYAERDTQGRSGPVKLHTKVFADHGDLPVLSLVIPTGSLLDPDTGLMVVGNAIFHAPEKVLETDRTDPRWWKYPGNFHMRGKAWEREGIVQLLDGSGEEVFQSTVDVRINGQMTRAFPQHALRLEFPERVAEDLFGEEAKNGYQSLVLRSAGNDQIKAMLRDAYQHDLCKGLPFDVSGHRTCVVYINGAYWGVHHIRHRMDDHELARRYGVKKKHITILEDEARYYRGDPALISEFEHLAYRSREWNGKDPQWLDTLNARIDVDGFLYYMATQMIVANMDWPGQNVKFWRYTGNPKAGSHLDGRWYFIMGDSDLGYGAAADAKTDLFLRVKAQEVPITWIFRALLRNGSVRAHFITIARELANGPFSAVRSLERLDRFVAHMAPEMERHTQRWRRPSNVATWQREVEVMRIFATERQQEVLDQLNAFEKKGN
ncbi:MAG: CotH kinase family protein [Flavobacteriales bacterium]|nr:CotH kinase family protein [Flavobacteriales bacterium]